MPKTSHTAAIAGGVVGGVAGFAILGVAGFVLRRNRIQNKGSLARDAGPTYFVNTTDAASSTFGIPQTPPVMQESAFALPKLYVRLSCYTFNLHSFIRERPYTEPERSEHISYCNLCHSNVVRGEAYDRV